MILDFWPSNSKKCGSLQFFQHSILSGNILMIFSSTLLNLQIDLLSPFYQRPPLLTANLYNNSHFCPSFCIRKNKALFVLWKNGLCLLSRIVGVSLKCPFFWENDFSPFFTTNLVKATHLLEERKDFCFVFTLDNTYHKLISRKK